MLRRLLLPLVAALLLVGYTSISDQMKDQLKKMPQQYSHFDVKMGWDVKAGNGGTIINGIIQNVRYAQMEDIEIAVSSLDANGKTVERAVTFVIPRRLDMDDVAPFTVELPVKAIPGTRMLFTYKYSGTDDNGIRPGSTYWMQSFESVVPSGI